ncbi:MAG: hypothetical protein H0X73_00130 [Chthoniobacterales bacterium]|nr:hypothetical protein [Chthoniobacterales bacterium]
MTFLKRILLIHSAPRATAVVRKALENSGDYLIKEEHDSRCAINAARWFQPNLILFDAIASGAEATSTAQQFEQEALLKDTPVVFFSSPTPGEDRVLSSGVLSGYSFLANPVGIEEFVRCVAELLKPASR